MNSNTVVSGTIYGLHNGDGNIRYIGYTTKEPKKRLQEHRSAANRGNFPHRPLFRWIVKHGADTIVMDILEYYPDIPFEDLKVREIVSIAQARSAGWSLLNVTDGGDGCVGRVFSEDHLFKLAEAARERAKSQDTSGARNNFYGRAHTEETKLKLSLAKKGSEPPNKGKPMSDEQRYKLRVASHKRWHVDRPKGPRANPDCSFCMV